MILCDGQNYLSGASRQPHGPAGPLFAEVAKSKSSIWPEPSALCADNFARRAKLPYQPTGLFSGRSSPLTRGAKGWVAGLCADKMESIRLARHVAAWTPPLRNVENPAVRRGGLWPPAGWILSLRRKGRAAQRRPYGGVLCLCKGLCRADQPQPPSDEGGGSAQR